MVKNFKAFNESNQSNEDIHSICEEYGIKNYTINDDRSIDVNGNVYLANKVLTKLPLKFRNISGNFICYNNRLITLEGCPQSVGGVFDCNNNRLITLEGCPQSVGGGFSCSYNKLITLEFSPKSISFYFFCHNNQLTTLKGAPQSIGGIFSCSDNKLKSLEFLPLIGGDFKCIYNPINKWFSMINKKNEQDVEAFLDFNIDSDDPDDINQEKIDMINNN